MLFLTPLQANQTRPRPRGRPTKFGHASCRRHLNIGPLAARSRPVMVSRSLLCPGWQQAMTCTWFSHRQVGPKNTALSQPAAEHHQLIHNGIARSQIWNACNFDPTSPTITSSIRSFTSDKQMPKLTETAYYSSHENVPERWHPMPSLHYLGKK